MPPPKAESPADAYVLPVPRDAVKLTKEMVEPPPASFKGHLVIPEGIQVIEFLAFSFGFEGIDIIELTLPESLKKMEEFEPQGLKKITTGAGVQFDLYPDFQKAYTEIYGSAAGTYILKGDTWEQV
ncbi:hypothetical protein FACS189491_02260 [Spirochaetia bacterium]|nr:hypothetical protein FACS189491_02260 [Spirochaetia bacterium]